MKKLAVICLIGWLLTFFKHFTVFPILDYEEHEITGIEFRIKFEL